MRPLCRCKITKDHTLLKDHLFLSSQRKSDPWGYLGGQPCILCAAARSQKTTPYLKTTSSSPPNERVNPEVTLVVSHAFFVLLQDLVGLVVGDVGDALQTLDDCFRLLLTPLLFSFLHLLMCYSHQQLSASRTWGKGDGKNQAKKINPLHVTYALPLRTPLRKHPNKSALLEVQNLQ